MRRSEAGQQWGGDSGNWEVGGGTLERRRIGTLGGGGRG